MSSSAAQSRRGSISSGGGGGTTKIIRNHRARSQDTSGGVLGMLNPYARKSNRELLRTNPGLVEGAERLGPGYGSEELFRVPLSALESSSERRVTSTSSSSSSTGKSIASRSDAGSGRKLRSRSSSITSFQHNQSSDEYDSDDNEIAAAAAVGGSAPALPSTSYFMSPSSSSFKSSSSKTYRQRKATSSTVPTVATSVCTTPTTISSSRASTSMANNSNLGFAGIRSPHMLVVSAASATTCNSDYLGDGTYYADDNDDYNGDIEGGYAWGGDTEIRRKTSSILGEMPVMGSACSETKDSVYTYTCEVISSLNENIDGTDFAAVVIASLRRSNWVDARRQLVIDGGTYKYSDYMYSVENLSSQIEDYDHFVKKIEDLCIVTSEVAEDTVRKIVAAIISGRPGPIKDTVEIIQQQPQLELEQPQQYESGCGDDDASQGSNGSDSRFSVASSLGRRSRDEIQSFVPSPARIRQRSISFGGTFDSSANDEVPQYIAIDTDSRVALAVPSDVAGDMYEEDELVLDQTDEEKDGKDYGDDWDDMPFGASLDIHSVVNEINSTSDEEKSSIGYFSTSQLTLKDLVKFCEELGIPVEEPKEADGNLEERILSAPFPLDGKPRLPGVAGRMVLAGVIDEHGKLRELNDQEKAEEAMEEDLDLNIDRYDPDPRTQLSNEEMRLMLSDNSKNLRPPTLIGPRIDPSSHLDRGLFEFDRPIPEELPSRFCFRRRASHISASTAGDDFEDTDDEEDVGSRKASAKRTSRSVIHEESDESDDSDEDDEDEHHVLILGETEPRMQRLGVTCPRVRHHARIAADKMAQRVQSLVLHPLSATIHDVKMSDHRDDTVTYVIYAVYDKHGKLLKIGLASNLKIRKELGYSDDDDITIRMIFSIDNMPPEMDKAVVKIYHEFWDAIRDDSNVDPYFRRLEKLVRDEMAGALGADRNIVGRLIEYGLQRGCSLAAPFEGMTGDIEVLKSRKESMVIAAKSLLPVLDKVLQLSEFSGSVETFALASWKTALHGRLRSSKIDLTELIVGVGNWKDTVEHIIFPDATTMTEVYGREALDWPPHVLALALEIMHDTLAYSVSTSRDRPLFIIVDRNRDTGWRNSRKLEEVIEQQYGFTRVAEVNGNGEVVVFAHKEARTILCLHPALSVAADARSTCTVSVELAVQRCSSAAFMSYLARHAMGRDFDNGPCAIEAGARVEWMRKALRLDARLSAAVARQTFTPGAVNAILESNLPLAGDPSVVGSRSRYSTGRHHRLQALANVTDRVNDSSIMWSGVCDIVRAGDDEDLLARAVAGVHQRFLESGNVVTATRNARWDHLFDYFVEDSTVLARVKKLRAPLMVNRGNWQACNAEDEEKVENNRLAAIIYVIPYHTPYWLLDQNQEFPEKMPATLESPNPKHGGASYPVYRIRYDTIRNRLPKSANKNRKKASISVEIPALRPPAGWDMGIENRSTKTSRTVFNGSKFVLCISKPKQQT